jgi:hypothetical protein
MGTASGPRAIFGGPKRKVPGVLARAQAMYGGITENAALFVGLPITMVAFLALITALVLSQQAATGTKARGSATLRNTKRDAVWTAMANASRKVTFNWQWSGNNGQSWNDARATPYANTDVVGLALMSTYSFRVSVTIGKATGAWSQPVSLLVH